MSLIAFNILFWLVASLVLIVVNRGDITRAGWACIIIANIWIAASKVVTA